MMGKAMNSPLAVVAQCVLGRSKSSTGLIRTVFYDEEAEAGDVEMVNGFVMMDCFHEETVIDLINEIWTLDIMEYNEKVDSAQQKATQFSTVEDVLKQMGALRPLKKNGDLSEKGWVAFETLRNFLNYLAQQNVVKFYEDKLDEFIDKD